MSNELAATLREHPELLLNPKVQEHLRTLALLKKNDPLAAYIPTPKQKLLHEAIECRYRAVFAGNRFGKTTCGVADDVIQGVDREACPPHLLKYKKWDPPFKCWIGVQKQGKIGEVILPKLRELIPSDQLIDGKFDKSYNGADKILRLLNGTFYGFKSYDQDLDAWAGADLHRVHFDEEPEGEHGEKIWEEAKARLVDHAGDVLFTLTPLLGLSFIYDQIYERRDEPNIFVIQASIEDNPHLDKQAVEDFVDGLGEEERKARAFGQFVHFKGLVYPEFEAKHVVKPPSREHIQKQEIVVGIDPGYRTTAVAFLAFDKDNACVLFDELYLHKDDALPGPVCEQIKLISRKWGVKPNWFYIDPVAKNASLQTGADNIQAAYFRAGIPVIEANNKVEAGILEVKRRFQANPPALLVSKDCQKWLEERSRYRLDDREDGKFEVVKVNDHLMDATRYACMARTWWQAAPPEPVKRDTYGEHPQYQPPYREQTFIEQAPPMGTYT